MKKLLIGVAALFLATGVFAHGLPPEEFDHKYDGTLNIVRMPIAKLLKECRVAVATACAKNVDDKTCNVFIIDDDDLTWFGMADKYDDILRHEIAHCNGWPADHRGERPRPK